MTKGETDTNVLRVLGEARRSVDETLTVAVPGIKGVDAKFAELARQSEAFDQGTRILRTGPEAQHPADVVEMFMAGPQGQMTGPSAVPFRLSQGARADIDRLIGTRANDLQALRNAVGGEGDWNRAKLVSAFGPDKTDDLLRIIDNETKMRGTFSGVMQNSETAARQAAQRDVAPRQFNSINLMDILSGLPRAGANLAARTRSEQINREVARALASRPSPTTIQNLEIARALAQARNTQHGLMVPAVPSLMLTN
jgi:hypothetical protein